MKTLKIGFDSFVIASRIVAILPPDSAPAKRLREEAVRRDMLIEAQKGRKCRAILVMDSNHVILSANSLEALQGRVENEG